MDKAIVTILGIGLIGFIWWFFFGKKEEEKSEVSASGEVDIVVEGGYKPSVIRVPVGKKTVINFLRKDENSCLEEVIIPDLKIRKFLSVGEKVGIKIVPKEKGTFLFQCGMAMFHGKIIVE